jgi:ABC-type antimicrobial peptide transport system permease subunit
MMIATCLVGISLLIFFDCYPTAEKAAERLDGGDGFILIRGDLEGFTDEKIKELIGDDTDRYYVYRNLNYPTLSLPFGDGDVGISLNVTDSSAFSREMNRFEVVKEDTSITENYVYLPYQFNTSGGFEIGDTYEYENSGKKYSFTVKGFTDVVYGGCNNAGRYEFVLDDASYKKIWDEEHETGESLVIIYDLKDGVESGAFRIRSSNDMVKVNPDSIMDGSSLDQVIGSRTFIGLIIAVSMLVMTVLIVAAVAMMLANCISNYITESMKTLGALKAIGYTGKNIRASLVLWFMIIACVASVIGNILSYVMMPVFAKIVIGQMGLSYSVSFTPLATVIPVGFVILFALLVTLISSRKISKIHPIVAMREGLESHNFKKNHVPLHKTSLSLNMSLAMKTFLGNKKQNVITFFVVGFMVFACVMSLLMYENFNRKPKLDILTTELCAGVVATDYDTSEDVREYLESREDVTNVREIINMDIYYNDEERLFTYIVKDPSKMKNQSICYKGRMPEYDNEVVVSGAFAKDYGFEIGDEIKLDLGDNSYYYLITGLIQTTNNNGREALLTYKAADHLIDTNSIPGWYWFDLADESDDTAENEEVTQKIVDECQDKFGEHVINTMNFYKIIGGSMTTFKGISAMMLVLMISMSVIVIALILFLLIKSLIYHKRKDYGIYKALGYTSGSLMLQTAMSFMPAVVLSIIVFSIVSYYIANPYMSTFMRLFGLMQCNFPIPIVGVILVGTGLAVISFFLALLQTRRIKKIEAYNMLVAE